MKTLILLIIPLALLGCDTGEEVISIDWVIYTKGRPGEEIQKDLDIMGELGWWWSEDDDNEEFGNVIYFHRRKAESAAKLMIEETAKKLKGVKQ